MNDPVENVYIGKLNARYIMKKDANGRPINRDIVKALNCQNNQMKSCLSEFESFKKLEELILESNNLKDEDLKTLKVSESLKVLDLSTNDLVSVPFLKHNGLCNLEKLLLKGNKIDIDDVVDHLTGFKNLKHLEISFTGIDHIPLHIRRLQSLEYLDISGNKLPENEFPQFVCSLKNLKTLRMDYYGEALEFKDNILEEFLQERVSEFCNLQPNDNHEILWSYSRGSALKFMKDCLKLEQKKKWPEKKILKLWCNSAMLGDLNPDDRNTMNFYFKALKGLREVTLLSLCTNNFSHMPNISQFESLQELGLCRNNFKEIPSQVRALPKLTHLYITENQITRVMFNEDDFMSLQFLDLLDNPICYVYDAAVECKESRKKLECGEKCQIKGLDAVIENGFDIKREESINDKKKSPENEEDESDDDLDKKGEKEDSSEEKTMKPVLKDVKGVPIGVIRDAKLCEINKDTRKLLKMRLDRSTGAGTGANWEDWAEGLDMPSEHISYIRDFLVKKPDISPTDSVIEWALDQDADFTVGEAYDAMRKCKAAAKLFLEGVAGMLMAKNQKEMARLQEQEPQYYMGSVIPRGAYPQFHTNIPPYGGGYPMMMNPADRSNIYQSTMPFSVAHPSQQFSHYGYQQPQPRPPFGQQQYYGGPPTNPPGWNNPPAQPPPYTSMDGSVVTTETGYKTKETTTYNVKQEEGTPDISSLSISTGTGSTSSIHSLDRFVGHPSVSNYCGQPIQQDVQPGMSPDLGAQNQIMYHGQQQSMMGNSSVFSSDMEYSVHQPNQGYTAPQYDPSSQNFVDVQAGRCISETVGIGQQYQHSPQTNVGNVDRVSTPPQSGSNSPNVSSARRESTQSQGIECTDEPASIFSNRQDRSLSLPSEFGDFSSMRSPEESIEPGYGPVEQVEPVTPRLENNTSNSNRGSILETDEPKSISDVEVLRKASTGELEQDFIPKSHTEPKYV